MGEQRCRGLRPGLTEPGASISWLKIVETASGHRSSGWRGSAGGQLLSLTGPTLRAGAGRSLTGGAGDRPRRRGEGSEDAVTQAGRPPGNVLPRPNDPRCWCETPPIVTWLEQRHTSDRIRVEGRHNSLQERDPSLHVRQSTAPGGWPGGGPYKCVVPQGVPRRGAWRNKGRIPKRAAHPPAPHRPRPNTFAANVGRYSAHTCGSPSKVKRGWDEVGPDHGT